MLLHSTSHSDNAMNNKTNHTETLRKRQIAVLGSTGSIGTQALQVIEEHSDLYEVYALTAGSNVQLLIEQARKFMPDVVVIAREEYYATLADALADLPIKVYAGEDALADVVQAEAIDIVLASMVGYAGLRPTMNAIRAGKAIALANKETLVVAGELVTQLAIEHHVPILPVDSEHSAIFQCLAGEHHNPIEKLLLTASGGPFRTWSMEQLQYATRDQALKHPNWDMGAKITIDSATLVNKGFEVIEAHWLFGTPAEKIDVVIHPESIIHSMVEFEDGSIKAQMGEPDMRTPISIALMYPERAVRNTPPFDFTKNASLTFREVDNEKYPALGIAYDCLRRGGSAAATMNGANEVAVAAFLKGQCRYTDIVGAIEYALAKAQFSATPSLSDYAEIDAESRRLAKEFLKL